MNVAVLLLQAVSLLKAHPSTILAIVSGIGMILSKNYSEGASQIFQALLVLFGGSTVVGLQSSLTRTQAQVESQFAAAPKA
jgi:hypothetical protein